ncbi:hypothetical protein TREPR_0621 [Treponema primitia ZAS-2]|uniref:WCX domain-containing protein n=1 Tax=Treponema primitia (strain ATCC BAA-887 / DSM 12427 / ZAS-2) TaxID=545694 RepID=F5YKM3_TREPZ|nr:WYL domain-containing transcriptional regulator [Treponema primitia]AEF84315.1 hypothetical protein TREPR_0621 [Treponema primitia ZAS-2]
MKGGENEKKIQISRVLKIDEKIRLGSYPTCPGLAKELEVSIRTINRDIDYLRDVYKAPLKFDRDRNGFYYTEPNFFIKSILFTEAELEIIKQYYRFYSEEDEDSYEAKFKKIFQKLLAVVPDKYDKDLPVNNFDGSDFFNPGISYEYDIITEINSAIIKKEVIKAQCWIAENRKYSTLTLEPVHIFYQNHIYYLLALDRNDDRKSGIFSVKKFKKVLGTGTYFELPVNFNIQDHIKNSADVHPADNKMYLFELLFQKDATSFASEATFHPKQTVKALDDNTVQVSFRSTEFQEIQRWVLSLGHLVKVLSPPELVDKMRFEIEQLQTFYQKGNSKRSPLLAKKV